MEITLIETRAFEKMMCHFESFVYEIQTLCGDGRKKEEWLTNDDVCRLLKMSKRSLQSLRDAGTLPFSQIGHKCYYKKSDVEQFFNR